MRTTKRFTPDVLDRFRREGRGTGCYERYIPWHRVSRGDPSSSGRSHLVMWRGRHRELLSDAELDGFLFSMLLPNQIDGREQFPLSQATSVHELSEYDVRWRGREFPGTLELARRLGVRHPRVYGGGESANWVLTTDLLLTIEARSGHRRLLAISVKHDTKPLSKRTRQLLTLEREYWHQRDVEWLLLTPVVRDQRVALLLRCAVPWTLGAKVDARTLAFASSRARAQGGHSLNYILNDLADHLGEMDLAQRAFWQNVVIGNLTLDMRRGWRPHAPVHFLGAEQFRQLNPIAAGRTAWI